MMKINIYDHATGKVIERDMTADEETNYELLQSDAEKEAQIEADRKATKEAVLAKLGLTADEVAALLS